MRYNLSYSNEGHGVFIENARWAAETYGNVSYGNEGNGLAIGTSGSGAESYVKNQKLYNNTTYNNVVGIVVGNVTDQVENGVMNNLIKNNISVGNSWRELWAGYGGENDGTEPTARGTSMNTIVLGWNGQVLLSGETLYLSQPMMRGKRPMEVRLILWNPILL